MLRLCDSFDNYTTSADLLRNFAYANSWVYYPTGGVNNTGYVGITANGQARRYFTTGTGRIYVAFWFRANSPVASAIYFMHFYKGGSESASIRLGTSGQMNFRSSYGDEYTAMGPNVCDGAWHWIEWDWLQTTSNGIAGSIKYYVDGVQHMNIAGRTTAQAGPDNVFWNGTATGQFVDDWLIWDDVAGDGFTTTPLGVRFIETLRPNAPGSLTGLTPYGTAANWDAVNDAGGHDNDTSVVYGMTGADLYNYTNLVSTPTAITALVLNSTVRADGAGTFNVANKIKSGAASPTITPVTVAGGSYRTVSNVFVTDPNTSAAWTKTAVDDLEAGVEIV